MEEFIEQSSLGTKLFCAGGLCLVISVTTLIMMAVATVEPTEIGVLYNNWTKTIYDDTYTGGMHYAGVVSSFVKFPATEVTVEFSNNEGADKRPLATRTKEGLALNLHFSFQYKIQPDNLQKLYALTGELDYSKLYQKIAGDTILKQAGEYQGNAYWTDRTAIGLSMQQKLNAALQKAYADCIAFQFLNIDLPNEYEQAIVNTQIENQQKETFEYKQQTALIQGSIDVNLSAADKQIAEINADANADALRAKKNAEADIRQVRINNESSAWKTTKEKLGFTTSQELLNYVYLSNLRSLTNGATLIYGIDNPTIRMKN